MLKLVLLASCLTISSSAFGQSPLAEAASLCELHRHRDLTGPANSAQIAAAPFVYDSGFEKCEAIIKQHQAAKTAHELKVINGVAKTVPK